jgi:hypothetical protein
MASSLSCDRDTAVAVSGGHSFTAASPKQLAYFEEDYAGSVYLIGSPEDKLPLRSLVVLIHVPGGGCPAIVLSSVAISTVGWRIDRQHHPQHQE